MGAIISPQPVGAITEPLPRPLGTSTSWATHRPPSETTQITRKPGTRCSGNFLDRCIALSPTSPATLALFHAWSGVGLLQKPKGVSIEDSGAVINRKLAVSLRLSTAKIPFLRANALRDAVEGPDLSREVQL